MAPNSAKKWVSTSSGKLVVTSAGDTVLGKIPAAVPVNLVSIVGPARNGKSSLMNAIIGNGDTFKMSPAVKPCTEGGDLSPHTVRLSEIDIKNAGMDGAGQETAASTRSHLDPDDDPYVAFADVEGQGDESVEHDVRLATPFLLLSRVIIFNWLGNPNKTAMLEKLKLMLMAADSVQQEDGGKGKIFGHLIILARDLSGPGKAEEISELLLDHEDARSSGDRKGVANRNTLRDDLRRSFESIIVRTLPVPHPDITERDVAISPSDFTPRFKTAVKALRTDIIEMLKTPHMFGGSPILGGDHMSSVMASLCEAVNDSKDISPPSLLQAIDARRVQKAVTNAISLVTVYLEDMEELTLSSKMASEQVELAKSSALDEFRKTAKNAARDIIQEEQQKLEKTLAALIAAAVGLQDKKHRDLDNMLAKYAKKAMAVVDDKTQRVSVPASSPAKLKGEFDRIVREAYAVYAKTLAGTMPANRQGDLQGDLPWALTKAEFSNKVEGSFSRLQERNSGAIQLQEYKKEKEAAQRRERLAQQDKEKAEKAQREANRRAEAAAADRAAAAEARDRASRIFHPPAQNLPMYPMTFGAPPMSFGGAYGAPPMSYGGAYGIPPMPFGGGGQPRFFGGGQFLPGGGRAPRGGTWM